MKYTIFYSWQSDLPNNTNRGFIEEALKTAAKSAMASAEFELTLTIDKDTQDLPGAPEITAGLMEKIRTCDAFIADISIVTGGLNGSRPSPNPNVLIELGYAAGLLGWEKILLVCNEHYGTERDLPFDIRQHRIIKYSVAREDPKSDQRKSLSSQLTGRIKELLGAGKSKPKTKMPELVGFWHPAHDDESQENVLVVSPADQLIDQIVASLRSSIELVNSTDGSIDPFWPGKVVAFRAKAAEFLSSLEREEFRKSVLLRANSRRATKFTLGVENRGNAPATDVRLIVDVPPWLWVFEKLGPLEPEFPERPVPVAPKKKKWQDSLQPPFEYNLSRIDELVRGNNATAGCSFRDGKLEFWADRLMHKHTRFEEEDSFYALAAPEAPLGLSELDADYFSGELDDWVETKIGVEVRKDA